MRIDQVYEYTISNVGEYNSTELGKLFRLLEQLRCIDKVFDDNSQDMGNFLIQGIAESVNNKEEECNDVMTLSAMVYKGQQRGLDVEPLIDAMNANGHWLWTEQLKQMEDEAR